MVNNPSQIIQDFYVKYNKPSFQKQKSNSVYINHVRNLEYFWVTPDGHEAWDFGDPWKNYHPYESELWNIVDFFFNCQYVPEEMLLHGVCSSVKELAENSEASLREALPSIINLTKKYASLFPARERYQELQAFFEAINNNIKSCDELCELWVLKAEICDSYVQWLPREMVEDTLPFFSLRFFLPHKTRENDAKEEASLFDERIEKAVPLLNYIYRRY